jgi:hypothetical protein
MASSSASAYKNTLIFSVLVLVLLLAILAATVYWYPVMSSYFYLVLTVELGLIFVIVSSLWTILSYDRFVSSQLRDVAKNGLGSRSCPDYTTAVYGPNGVVECRNVYLGKSFGEPMAMVFLDAGGDKTKAPGTIVLSDLDGKTVRDVCGIDNPAQASSGGAYNLPWTEIRPRCSAIASEL